DPGHDVLRDSLSVALGRSGGVVGVGQDGFFRGVLRVLSACHVNARGGQRIPATPSARPADIVCGCPSTTSPPSLPPPPCRAPCTGACAGVTWRSAPRAARSPWPGWTSARRCSG